MGDDAPHFTNVASLISQILDLCDRQSLIGHKMVAIDRVKVRATPAMAGAVPWADPTTRPIN